MLMGPFMPKMMEIPELEDEGHEDITKVVADAPKVPPKHTHLLYKLDDHLGDHLGSTTSGADLSLLMACLCSKEEVSTRDCHNTIYTT